jgi:hypothetical protein
MPCGAMLCHVVPCYALPCPANPIPILMELAKHYCTIHARSLLPASATPVSCQNVNLPKGRTVETGDRDWRLGLETGTGDWDWRLGLEIGTGD